MRTFCLIISCLLILSIGISSDAGRSKLQKREAESKVISCYLEDALLFDVIKDTNEKSEYCPFVIENDGDDFILSAKLPESGEGMGARVQFVHHIKSPRHIFIPHLAPEPGFVIGDHSFRSPAIILSNNEAAFVIIPSIDDVGAMQNVGLRTWLDYDHATSTITVAVGNCEKSSPHVSYKSTPAQYTGQSIRLRLHVFVSKDKEDLDNPYGMAAKWHWARWGHALHNIGGSQKAPISKYGDYINNWTFTPEPKGWGNIVWQEVTINGRKCGAPAFIVDVMQHPSKPVEKRQWREQRAVWNQAWFSTQRCANGLLRYARQVGSKEIEESARLMTQFALSAPQTDGLFPAVYTTGKDETWATAFWTNSNRRPDEASENAYHILDASFTARLLLEWSDLMGGDKEADDYVLRYADRLCRLQHKNGAFPGWVEPDGKEPTILAEGPESAMSAALLLEMVEHFPTNNEMPKWKAAAKAALAYLENGPVAESRWEDFETYFSCSRWGTPGQIVARNGVYKQNTFSPFWCAEAFYDAYKVFGDDRYLKVGRRCLDELSLYQQVWSPDYITAECHGGFGVMNLDGEWNDARQSLFAPIYLEYYKVTGNPEYFERGVAAMRAGFAMVYCPENDKVKKAYERDYSYFGPESYGFEMENILHGGPGGCIGSFTIYTWGNGAALSTAARIRDMYGDLYIDTKRKEAFGIDGCNASIAGSEVTIQDRFNRESLLAVYDNGTRQTVKITDGVGKLPLRLLPR